MTPFSRAFVLLLLVATAAAFVGMVRDIILAVVLAAIFSGLLQPIFRWTLPRLGGGRTLTAAFVLAVTVLAVGLPLAGLAALILAEAVEISQIVGPYVKQVIAGDVDLPGVLPAWAPAFIEPYETQIVAALGDGASLAASGLVQSLTRATRGTALFLLNLGVMLYAMFFFLRDGREWLEGAASYLPLKEESRTSILEKGLTITSATLQSILVIGAIQGLLVGLVLWATGVPGAAFWGAMVVPASAIPGLGAPLIWAPAAAYLLISGSIWGAVIVTVWGALVVGTVDNVLRAWLVGTTTKMPELLVLVATLGGIGTLGPIGIIIGPVLAGLLLTMLEIYREAFRDALTEAEGRSP